MEAIPAAMLALLIKQVVDFLRYLKSKDVNGVVTTITAWIGGVVATLLAAQTDWAAALNVGGVSLESMNFASQVFAGLTVAATATGFNEVVKAVNNDTSTSKPKLVGEGESYRPLAG